MKIEDQVCSLELSKKIKELKVKQDSLWYFIHFEAGWTLQSIKQVNNNLKAHRKMGDNMFAINALSEFWRDDCISAFTVAELGELLNKKLKHNYYINGCFYLKSAESNVYSIEFTQQLNEGNLSRVTEDKTEANARAKMLIYLIKNKQIEIK